MATGSILEEDALPSKWWEQPDFLCRPEEESPKDGGVGGDTAGTDI